MCERPSTGMMRARWIISLTMTTYPGDCRMRAPLLYTPGIIIPITPRVMQRSADSMNPYESCRCSRLYRSTSCAAAVQSGI